jgi:endonuclease/exonuclease/phosphatase family metal-dependent hydrolase
MQRTSSQKLLSDHAPFIVKSENETLFSWNILCQMKFNEKWKYFNNGFICPAEDVNEYRNRLSHIAARLDAMMPEEHPSFICLQECPGTVQDKQHFIETIQQTKTLKNYLSIQHSNNSVDLISLYDPQRYAINNELSSKIQSTEFMQGLKDRVLAQVFTSMTTKKTILVVNVHADFGKEVQQDIKSLNQHAGSYNIDQIILLGDFNRDLLLQSDDYSKHDISTALDVNHMFDENLHVGASQSSSFCTKYNKETSQKGQGLETRDGALASFPIQITCLPKHNFSSTLLSFNNPISSHLSTIPPGFLEKLMPQMDEKPQLSIGNLF